MTITSTEYYSSASCLGIYLYRPFPKDFQNASECFYFCLLLPNPVTAQRLAQEDLLLRQVEVFVVRLLRFVDGGHESFLSRAVDLLMAQTRIRTHFMRNITSQSRWR